MDFCFVDALAPPALAKNSAQFRRPPPEIRPHSSPSEVQRARASMIYNVFHVETPSSVLRLRDDLIGWDIKPYPHAPPRTTHAVLGGALNSILRHSRVHFHVENANQHLSGFLTIWCRRRRQRQSCVLWASEKATAVGRAICCCEL